MNKLMHFLLLFSRRISFVNIKISNIERWSLGLSHLFVIENDPVIAFFDVADIVASSRVFSKVTYDGMQSIVAWA
eukprot:m.161975 g.161975  ORF g.161975 m.161975 type:complete len:75 (-) comp15194_c0_seq6:2589-2813(-)